MLIKPRAAASQEPLMSSERNTGEEIPNGGDKMVNTMMEACAYLTPGDHRFFRSRHESFCFVAGGAR
jgi:hypothetical protein